MRNALTANTLKLQKMAAMDFWERVYFLALFARRIQKIKQFVLKKNKWIGRKWGKNLYS